MLYRGVLLTLVSLWVRDRLYEAGASDVLDFLDDPLSPAAATAQLDALQV